MSCPRPLLLLLIVALALLWPAGAHAAPAWLPGDGAAVGSQAGVPGVVVSDAGTTWVAINPLEGLLIATRPAGGAFGPAVAVPGADEPELEPPVLATTPAGGALVAWTTENGGVQAVDVAPDGTPGPLQVLAAPGGAHSTAVGVGDDGTAAVAYAAGTSVTIRRRGPGRADFEPAIVTSLGGTNVRAGLDVDVRPGFIAVGAGTNGFGAVVAGHPFKTSAVLKVVELPDEHPSAMQYVMRTAAPETPSAEGSTSVSFGHVEVALRPDGGLQLAAVLRRGSEATGRHSVATVLGSSLGDFMDLGHTDGTLFLSRSSLELEVDAQGRSLVAWRDTVGPGHTSATAAVAGPRHPEVSELVPLVADAPGVAGPEVARFGPDRLAVVAGAIGAGRPLEGRRLEAGGTLSGPETIAAEAPVSAPVAVAGDGAGSGVAVWGASDGPRWEPFDASAPELRSSRFPASATLGAPAAFGATAFDRWSTPGLAWDFGDGTGATGATVSRTYARAGTFTARVIATDEVQNASAPVAGDVAVSAPPTGPSAPPAQAPATTATATATTTTTAGADATAPDATAPDGSAPSPALPVLRGARLSRTRFAPAGVPLPRGARRGSTLTATLDVPAPLRLTVRRVLPGFRRGARCVARRPAVGRARRCGRTVMIGTLRGVAAATRVRVALDGRVRGRALPAGNYRLTVTPAGGRPVTLAFRVVRRAPGAGAYRRPTSRATA